MKITVLVLLIVTALTACDKPPTPPSAAEEYAKGQLEREKRTRDALNGPPTRQSKTNVTAGGALGSNDK